MKLKKKVIIELEIDAEGCKYIILQDELFIIIAARKLTHLQWVR